VLRERPADKKNGSRVRGETSLTGLGRGLAARNVNVRRTGGGGGRRACARRKKHVGKHGGNSDRRKRRVP